MTKRLKNRALPRLITAIIMTLTVSCGRSSDSNQITIIDADTSAGVKAVSSEPVVTVDGSSTPTTTGIISNNSIIYKIEPGDTISELAERFNVSTSQIQQANPNLNDIHDIAPGQELVIPLNS